MADALGGGFGGGEGLMGQFPLEQWFYEMPVCTRWWTAATVLVSVLVQCHVLSPYQLFYSYRTVFLKNQYWRLITTFFYFGPLNLDLLFHVFFLQRYSRYLEESSGRSPAHFSWLLAYASVVLLGIAPLFSMPFLGSALSSTLVYIWSRRNPETRMSFLGLFVFRAPFLPWVLMLFSLVLHGTVPKEEISGTVVGHMWYYFNDLYPQMHDGHRPFDPPQWWRWMFEGTPQVEEQVDDADEDAGTGVAADVAAEPINPNIPDPAAPPAEVR